MRGNQDFQGAMFSYISPEGGAADTPAAQTARRSRCAAGGNEPRVRRGVRPPGPPLGAAGDAAQALLLQILFSIHGERQLVEAVSYNLLYRWFVGLNIEDKVWTTPPSAPTARQLFSKTWPAPFSSRSTHTAD